jgi:site-specific DNA-cytosine methylase
MENVPNIVSMGKGVVKDNIIEDFEKLGYNVVYKVLLASEFGVPQNRRRAFFIGTKGKKFSNSLKLKILNLFHQVKPFLIYLKNQLQTEQNIHKSKI